MNYCNPGSLHLFVDANGSTGSNDPVTEVAIMWMNIGNTPTNCGARYTNLRPGELQPDNFMENGVNRNLIYYRWMR